MGATATRKFTKQLSTGDVSFPLANQFNKDIVTTDIIIKRVVKATVDNQFVFNSADKTIQSDNQLFLEFFINDTFTVSGTASNDGTYTVQFNDGNIITTLETLVDESTITAILVDKQPITKLNYYYGLIENNETKNYLSKADGSTQIFEINGLDATVATPVSGEGLGAKSWQIGLTDEVKVIGTGAFGSGVSDSDSQCFQIIQTLFWNPFILENEYNDLKLGKLQPYFNSNNCLKHILRVEAFADVLSPNNFLSVEINNILGNTGGLGEKFNNKPTNYTVESIVYKNAANEIISGIEITTSTTVFDIIIKNASSPFVDGASKFIFSFALCKQPSEIDKMQNLFLNFLFSTTDAITIGNGAGGYGSIVADNNLGLFNIKAKFISSSEISINGECSNNLVSLFETATKKYLIGIQIQKNGLATTNPLLDLVTLPLDLNDFYIDTRDNSLIDFVTEEPLNGVQYWYRPTLGVSTGNLFQMSHIMYLNQGTRDLSKIDFKSLKMGVLAEKEFLYIPYTNVLGNFKIGDIIGTLSFFGNFQKTTILEDTGMVLKTYDFNKRDLVNWFLDGNTLQNYILETGIITSSLASTTVIGTGTKFTTELIVGALLYDYDNNFIGEIATITDNFTLDLVVNAAVAITDSNYNATTRIVTINAPAVGDVYIELEDAFSLDEKTYDLSLIQKANDVKNDTTTKISTVHLFDYRNFNIPDTIGGVNDPYKTISIKRRKDVDCVEIDYENESAGFTVGNMITNSNSTITLKLIAKKTNIVTTSGTYYLQGTNADIVDWLQGAGVLIDGIKTADAITDASMKYAYEVRMPIFDGYEYWKQLTTLTTTAKDDFYDATNPKTATTLGNQLGYNNEWYHYNQIAGWKVKYRLELTTNDRSFPAKATTISNTYNTKDKFFNFNINTDVNHLISSGAYEEDGKLFDYNSNLKWGKKTLTTWKYDSTNSPTFKGTSLLVGGTHYCLGSSKTVVEFTFDGRVLKIPYYKTSGTLVVGAILTNTTLTQTGTIDSFDDDYIYIVTVSGGTWALGNNLTTPAAGSFIGKMSGNQLISIPPTGFLTTNLQIVLGIETFELGGTSEINFATYRNLGVLGSYWSSNIYSFIIGTGINADLRTGYAIIDNKFLPKNNKFKIHLFWTLANANTERGDHITLDVEKLEEPNIPLVLDLVQNDSTCCDFKLNVLASLSETFIQNEFVNDKSDYYNYSTNITSSVLMVLQKYNGSSWDDKATLNNNTYGLYSAFGHYIDDNNNKYFGYTLDWQKILVAATFGTGTYRIKITDTLLFGGIIIRYSNEWCLQEYSKYRAEKTCKIEVYNKEIKGMSGSQKLLIDYGTSANNDGSGTNRGRYNAIRIPAIFGYPEADKNDEYNEYSPTNKEWITSQFIPKYMLKSQKLLPGWLHDILRDDFMQGDEILITDYYSKNVKQFIKTEVIQKGAYKPDLSTKNNKGETYIELTFEDRYNAKRNRRTFNSN